MSNRAIQGGLMKRFGQVIKLKPEGRDTYIKLHANPREPVSRMIKACHMENYSIFIKDDFLFAYFEYTGDDYEADMAKMAEDPDTQQWWSELKPFMEPLESNEPDEFWGNMTSVFFLQ